MVQQIGNTAKPVLVSWSGGKDSCLALYLINQLGDSEVKALVTTVTGDYDRISMHGVRRVLLERQAAALGLPLQQVVISKDATNEEYESRITETLLRFKADGISSIVFGDLFLSDVRAYREQFLSKIQMTGIFPVWQTNTADFVRHLINVGFKSVITCVNGELLDESFAGRTIDEEFLQQLPPTVDPCGENGEFHSFVFDGPLFKYPIKFVLGETVRRGPFWFRDLVPT
jgi:uncharacterized protein (TIGR00290 family)